MRRRILILVAAAFLAMISGVAVFAYAHTADRRALNGQEGKWVLLATSVIPANTSGSEIRTKRLVRQVLMPAGTIPSGALTEMDTSLNDLRLNAPLQPDQILMRRQFEVSPTATGAPNLEIPKDRMAVSVELSAAPQVAGNVKSGDQVTVFFTYPLLITVGAKVKTYVLLPKVTVISVGESVPPTSLPMPTARNPAGITAGPTVLPTVKATNGDELLRYIVTFAVTQSEAQLLINASHTSLLYLGLLGANASVSPQPNVGKLLGLNS